MMSAIMSISPVFLLGAASIALLVFLIFLHRPDIALLVILIVRSFSDLSVTRDFSFLSPNTALTLLLLVCGGAFMLSRRVPFISLPGGSLLVFLFLVGLVAILRSESVMGSLYQWLRAASIIVPYALAAYLFRTPQRIQRVIDVFAVSFVVPALFGVEQVLHGGGVNIGGFSRVFGTFVHPAPFGTFLVVFLGVFFCQALVQSGARKLVALSITLVSLILIAATYTRVSWVGAIVVLITVGVLLRRTMLVLLPLAVVLAAVIINPSISNRLADLFAGGGSLADRQDIWLSTLSQWWATTYNDGSSIATVLNRLGGIGPGESDYLTIVSRGMSESIHDDYLAVLFNYGILGLLAFLATFFVLLRLGLRTWRGTSDKIMASIGLSLIALTVAYMVMSLTDNIFGATQNQLYFWTLAGLTVAISKIPSKERRFDSPRIREHRVPAAAARAALRMDVPRQVAPGLRLPGQPSTRPQSL